MTDKTAIANTFNTCFTNTVKTSTTELNTPSNKTFEHYMNEEHTHLFCFETIDDEIISKTIDIIQTKASCGFDGISSQLLKSLKPALMCLYSTCLIMHSYFVCSYLLALRTIYCILHCTTSTFQPLF